MTGILAVLAIAGTIGTMQAKEAPLQDPFPVVEDAREYYTVTFNISHYDDCYECCGKTDGITASGVKATPNHTIAAPIEYPFGTNIEIDGIMYTVEDRGGNINGNCIDIYVNSHEEARQKGRFYAEGKVFY